MIKILSPAKVNLYLRVLRKREDGYHDIATLMQRISLYDEMTFSIIDKGITLSCPGSTLPENENNIVYRAADALLSRLPHPPGIHITINKKIPVAAGLGGGSSNAATTLLTINDLLGFHYTTEDLMKIGAKLGADVPFFIFRKTAWAFGIGDRLQAAENIPPLWFILINPGFEISTKMIYDDFNLRLTKQAVKYKCPKFNSVDDLISGIHNDLEKVTLVLHPILQHLKNLLLKNGAHGAFMSGSGSTVAGIFGEEKEAAKAQESLANIGEKEWSVYRACSI
jgi:4-diphosphocytidyl-2-C-methyl-D-erythritol kinase